MTLAPTCSGTDTSGCSGVGVTVPVCAAKAAAACDNGKCIYPVDTATPGCLCVEGLVTLCNLSAQPGQECNTSFPSPSTCGITHCIASGSTANWVGCDALPAQMNVCGSQTACSNGCANLASDNANCGACGVTCGGSQKCEQGKCVSPPPCPSGQVLCNGACATLASDINNCGSCGKQCNADQACTQSVCKSLCSPNMTFCNGQCVDLVGDEANCGACGKKCGADQFCRNKVCAPCGKAFGVGEPPAVAVGVAFGTSIEVPVGPAVCDAGYHRSGTPETKWATTQASGWCGPGDKKGNPPFWMSDDVHSCQARIHFGADAGQWNKILACEVIIRERADDPACTP